MKERNAEVSADPLASKRRAANLVPGYPGLGLGKIDHYSMKESRRLREAARKKAERFLVKMEDAGLIDPIEPDDANHRQAEAHAEAIVDNDSAIAREAMKQVLIQAFLPGQKKDKLAAARTLLEFTKQKPVSKSNVAVEAPEDFLKALLDKE